VVASYKVKSKGAVMARKREAFDEEATLIVLLALWLVNRKYA
jgi:hypothetical protein